jgi:DNA-binding NtrC family response regulator
MSRNGKRILVAEDDDAARDILSALLVQAGYNVHAARNGREALTEMQRTHFDVVVMDCHISQLDGHELLSVSHTARPHTPIIMLSEGPTESLDETTRQGAYAWVEKPYDMWLLLEIIRNAAHDSPPRDPRARTPQSRSPKNLVNRAPS